MNKPSPSNVVRLALWFYVPMIASGVFVRPPGSFQVTHMGPLVGGLVLALLIGLATVGLSRLAARRTRWGRALHLEFRAALGMLNAREILLLSLLSAMGEETLFRGVLQPRLGLFWSAALFAAFHFPYRRTLIPWCAMAFVLGLVLGGMTEAFHSLWPAIMLHFFINYFNLHDLTEWCPPFPKGDNPPR